MVWPPWLPYIPTLEVNSRNLTEKWQNVSENPWKGKKGTLKYYPVFLDITSQKCVLVGGGEVALRKAARLVACGAQTIVVSPHLCPGLAEMKARRLVEHWEGPYDPSCLTAAFMVIGATDREEVNEKIARDARERGLLVNIVDRAQAGNFILPSLMKRGELVLAVSTGGYSPALARKMREDLERALGPEYGILADALGAMRPLITAAGPSSRDNREVFTRLVNSSLLGHIRDRDWAAAVRTVEEITGIILTEAFWIQLFSKADEDPEDHP
jgi:precorrin-2 dehydrogenase/sirohydrochlorin ferrochelatase